MEAARWVPYLKPGAKIIVNELEIPPLPVLMGRAQYPKGLLETLRARFDATIVKASEIAAEIGVPRVMNMVLLGAFVEVSGLTDINWEIVIAGTAKPQFLDANIAAYLAGRRAARNAKRTVVLAATA